MQVQCTSIHIMLITCVQLFINVRTVQFICIKCHLFELGATLKLTMLRIIHVRTKQFI